MGLSNSWLHPAFLLFVLGTGLAFWIWRRFSFRRGVQVFSLTLFTVLFWLTSFKGRPDWPVDFFLFSDPLLALVHSLSGRAFLSLLLVSLAFIALAAVMGRVYCSHICPLGSLLDIGDLPLKPKLGAEQNRNRYRKMRKAKFIFLLVILWAALFGFNLLGFGDPLVIFTRFAATVFYPFILLLADLGLTALRPAGEWMGWLELRYFKLFLPAYQGATIMTVLLVLLLLLGSMQSRFWCRHLCPLGALLGWIGRWAPYRRRVSAACSTCKECVRECPAGAIHENGTGTDRPECIVCLKCVQHCPENAVKFGFHSQNPAQDLPGVGVSRRAFLGGALGGMSLSLGMRADILHPSGEFHPLPLRNQGFIRPPGALPEPDFLRRCTRCGLCLRACPTNTLQPDWHRAGVEGLWAPVMNLRYAACNQNCNVCGKTCPTESIRPLSLDEKRHARVGTAVILRDKCLPYARDKRCLVCEEQCPYQAVELRKDGRHRFGLPVVDTKKCNGCGKCEDKCPVTGDSAIVVTPHGELRLSKASYIEKCRSEGFVFEDKDKGRNRFRLDDSKLPFQAPDHIE